MPVALLPPAGTVLLPVAGTAEDLAATVLPSAVVLVSAPSAGFGPELLATVEGDAPAAAVEDAAATPFSAASAACIGRGEVVMTQGRAWRHDHGTAARPYGGLL